MEKFSQIPNMLERSDNQSYEILREEAPKRAEALIARIENFAEKNTKDQLADLQTILNTLEEDNGNRFIAEYVAGKMYHIEAVAEVAEVAERKVRMEISVSNLEGYGGVVQMVSEDDKQELSPAAADQRAPTPALAHVA